MSKKKSTKTLKNWLLSNKPVIAAVIMVFLVIIVNITDKNAVTENEGLKEPQTTETIEVEFSEEDDDLSYNYFINPSKLDRCGIGAERIQLLAEEVNRVLNNDNIKGQQLEIISVEETLKTTTFKIKVVETEDIYTFEYDKKNGTITRI